MTSPIVNKAESFESCSNFLDHIIHGSAFSLTQISFSDQKDWAIKQGALSHFLGGFFHVNGIKNKLNGEEHLVLYQPQSPLTGLAIYKDEKQAYVLLQARIEPGNTNVGQYGPTIQSTPSNYLRLHGGKPTAYLDIFASFSPKSNPIVCCMQLDLGKLYYQKSKTHSYSISRSPSAQRPCCPSR